MYALVMQNGSVVGRMTLVKAITKMIENASVFAVVRR
jgi:hypothetical protein